ncbi:MAG TPA: hypothetical protein DD417_10645, partial [Elusimicrobia bacterium]|nr:hypothetical protein [Elusimicrobiota bacterium]
MVTRRHAVLALAAALLTCAARSSAAPAILSKVLQCDGTYTSGTSTRHPSPLVRADISDSVGLRVTPARMGVGTMSTTRALWRFDGGVSVSSQCVVSAACGGAGCREYLYTYADANASAPLIVGKCVYNSLAADCSTDDGLFLSTPVPVGLGACPAAVPPVGANTIFTTG